MFLVEAEAKPLLQFQHDAMFFFARGQRVIQIGLKKSLRLRQTVPEIQFGAVSEACNQAFRTLRVANLLEIKTGIGENY